LLTRAAKKLRHKFAPAAAADVKEMKRRKWPAKLVEFYSANEPRYSGRSRVAALRLLGIGEMLAAMEMLEPAATLSAWGYAPLAETGEGDMYLHNLNSVGPDGWPAVVFASHEAIGGEETREEAEDSLSDTASSLPEFLRMAVEGELEEGEV